MSRSLLRPLSAIVGVLWLAGCVSAPSGSPTLEDRNASAGGASSTVSGGEAKAPLLPSLLFIGDATSFVGWSCAPSQDVITAAQPEALRLWSAHGAEQLSQAVVASGSHYQKGEISAWDKGDELVVESSRGRLECQANTRRDSLRRSDKPGVMFFARGNEPGWHLSLANDVPRIDLTLDYGERKVSLPYRVTTLDNGEGRVILQSGRADAPFKLRVESRACFDDMAGTPWPARVTLDINGRQFKGCGQGIAP